VSRESRQATLFALALLGVVLLAGFLALRSSRPQKPPLVSSSNQPDGAKGLRLWLEADGIPVRGGLPQEYAIPDGVAVVLMLRPSRPVAWNASETLSAWIEAGGTLLMAQSPELREHFNLNQRFGSSPRRDLMPDGTVLAGPLPLQPLRLAPATWLNNVPEEVVPLLAREERIVIGTFPLGQGRVIVSESAEFFTNEALHDPANAALVRNLIAFAGAGPDAPVWFDDWHHGERDFGVPVLPVATGLAGWLRHTPYGQAVMLAGTLIFFVLLWQGRAFGRPLSLPRARTRRAPLEFVTALANLNRRAGNRQAVSADWQYRLKREIGRRARLDPHLPNPAWLQALRETDPTRDADQLADILYRLQHAPNDADLVRAAADAARATGNG
jgi:hypothetical protein